jgi:hypothetical protein
MARFDGFVQDLPELRHRHRRQARGEVGCNEHAAGKPRGGARQQFCDDIFHRAPGDELGKPSERMVRICHAWE